MHQSTPARDRRPSRVKRVKTSRSRMRQIKPTDGDGPLHDGPSGSTAPLGCSSGCESRASSHDDDYWVGRCASRHPRLLAGLDGTGGTCAITTVTPNARLLEQAGATNIPRLREPLRDGNTAPICTRSGPMSRDDAAADGP